VGQCKAIGLRGWWAETVETKEKLDGPRRNWAKNNKGCRNYFFNFSNKDLSLKVTDSNAFKPNLN
jgi:hypothetical protein